MPKLKNSIKQFNKLTKKTKIKPPNPKPKQPTFRYKISIEPTEKILFIGEGNFSFSLALSKIHHRADYFTCTSFDSKEICIAKYPESIEILSILEDLEASILFNIDCRNLSNIKQRFSKIFFNFPHVGMGIKDQLENIIENQKLILAFFESSKKKLQQSEKDGKDGEIIISLKCGIPYDLWNVKGLGRQSGLRLIRSFEFVPEDYEGYTHRRTIGYDEKISNPDNQEIKKNKSKTFVFQLLK